MKKKSVSYRIAASAFMLICPILLAHTAGCALLPVEDVNRTIPTIAPEKVSYKMTVVTRTDIVDAKTFSCNYKQTDNADLSFQTGGKTYGEVFVSVGSIVEKGDLLATLNMGNLEERIEALSQSVTQHEKALAQSEELMELEIKKVNTEYNYGIISSSQRKSRLESIEKSYAKTNDRLEETLYLERLEYDTLIAKRDSYSIYAPFDGVITYVSSEMRSSNKTSVKGKLMIQISKASGCVFQANTPLATYYESGDIVTITMVKGGTGSYDAVVERFPDNDELMYLYPTEEITDLQVGARANIYLLIDSRENVLAVDSSAIRSSQDFKYVYYVNEDGIRDLKVVETGLTGNGMTEIISGLEFGEAIIK